ncbi:hypothetical protein J5N97_022224 [Dioscorea zingiberensis]|uniref:Sister chromatid cohesion 1 protein 4-like n=1 Tax=Dioscorea zingiberensis TaxID=325984 RepID=A0A9D5HAM0_9LILI|nr:hypothetical protein J5N97_022224 [Dioscorea zingiberensis]
MFYSQFILAKKGPLGTIWIAAHLERKLRKNQVADTDIGVSVDSILFPEAPIALRLSSHLLLGVVRIYSRKVNYLFHDCSETLLKVKQAFRSTAVDLPPEESTAPYHSITLPETFHLDDFELPDSAVLHGNSVDHHVSTREQITLQDTRDGLGYSTSQFGLDERFGDGDASQIALDLDEDLFSDKVPSSLNAPVPFDAEDGIQHSRPSVTLSDMDIAEGQNIYGDMSVSTPKDLSEFLSSDHYKHAHLDMGSIKKIGDTSTQHGYNIQTPDLNEMIFPDGHIEGPSSTTGHASGASGVADVLSPELIECAQAPSTPSLIGEAIPANIQEIPPLSSQEKNSQANYLDSIRPETSGSPHSEFECPEATANTAIEDPAPVAPESGDIALVMPLPPLPELKPDSSGPQHSSGIVAEPDEASMEGAKRCADGFQSEFVSNKTDNLPDIEQLHDNGDTMLSETGLLDGPVSSTCSLEENNFQTLSHLDAGTSAPATVNNFASAPVMDPNITSHEETNLGNQSLVQDVNTSQHPQGTALEFSCKDIDRMSGAPASEEVLDAVVSSVNMQGDELYSTNVMDTIREVHQTSEIVLSENTSVETPQKLSSDTNIKDNQLDHLNYSATSEFPEPEKMLLAPICNDNMSNDLGQLTSEKGVTGSEESVGRIKSLIGRKRGLTESILDLQNGSSAKLPGRPRVRRNTENIPEDDDLLASILVGRTTNFKVQPTPPPAHKVSSLKRPRLNPKVAVPKRKVLFDDTMVLHADSIRQQLTNTEDIRRIRKKAPCTRSEIWMIQSCSDELEIFEESIFTGISSELHSLHNRTYTSNGKPDSQYGSDQFVIVPSKECNLLRSSKIVGEICMEVIDEQVVVLSDKVDGENEGPSCSWVNSNSQGIVKSLADLSPSEQLNDNICNPLELDGRATYDVPTVSAPNVGNVSEASIDCRVEATVAHDNHEIDASDIKSDDVCVHSEQQLARESSLCSNELKEINDETTLSRESIPPKNFSSVENDGSHAIINDDMMVLDEDVCAATVTSESKNEKTVDGVCHQDHQVDMGQIENNAALLSMDSLSQEIGKCLQTDASVITDEGQLCGPDIALEVVEPSLAMTIEYQHIENCKEGGLEVCVHDEAFGKQFLHDEEYPSSEMFSGERIQEASSCPLRPEAETENIPSTVGESPGLQEFNLEGGINVENTPVDFSEVPESSDFWSAVNGNDTEFLNVDDEEDYCEADDNIQNPKDAQSLENSGWSSRTRGVAKYLKSLFDDEFGHGRKAVTMDHLLVGKTRKEASRMFFETLVLKTKDYIHVEQEKPLDCLNIKPRIKLLKSEF